MATKKEDAFKELAPDCVDSELAARLTLVVCAASVDETAEVGAVEVMAAATTLEDEAVTEDVVLVVVVLAMVVLLTRGLASVGYCQFSSQ